MAGYLAKQKHEAWQLAVSMEHAELLDEAENQAMFEEEFRNAEQMIWESNAIVQTYFHKGTFDGWEILHVEEEFVVTIDEGEFTFTPDLVARDPFGKVWIIDHKSTSSVPTNGVPFSSQQSLIYFAGVKAFYPEAVGFMFNFLRKKLPTEPRLNKTKTKESGLYHVNNLNAIDTTFEVLFNFIRDEAPELMAEESHKRRLAELRDQPDRFFFTQRVLANEVALQTIIDETSMVMGVIIRAIAKDEFPRTLRDDRGYESCEKCEFNSICMAELLDLNTDIVLGEYEPREAKNPYEKDEDDG
jgi:hypothetical protein